jgi:hypothetical protein
MNLDSPFHLGKDTVVSYGGLFMKTKFFWRLMVDSHKTLYFSVNNIPGTTSAVLRFIFRSVNHFRSTGSQYAKDPRTKKTKTHAIDAKLYLMHINVRMIIYTILFTYYTSLSANKC